MRNETCVVVSRDCVDVVYLKANEFLKIIEVNVIGNSGPVAIIFVLKTWPNVAFSFLVFYVVDDHFIF